MQDFISDDIPEEYWDDPHKLRKYQEQKSKWAIQANQDERPGIRAETWYKIIVVLLLSTAMFLGYASLNF